ncbi:hypothetical protein [Photobacterium damselae]|uniref:hypothetical protein n=1 Tax=Photobacterium damselae TaxID=38293 RepID=UPI00406919D1
MKINMNFGVLGGEVVKVVRSESSSIVWISHEPPEVGNYKPQPLRCRLKIANEDVDELELQVADQIVCNVEVATHTTNNSDTNRKETHTEYVVTDILSFCHDGIKAMANTFMVSGNVARIDENGDWSVLTLAVSKGRNAPTNWLRLPIHNSFYQKVFKQPVLKGDWIFVQSNLETRMFKDSNGKKQLSNDFKIQRLLGVEHKFNNVQQPVTQGINSASQNMNTQMPQFCDQSGIPNFGSAFDDAFGVDNNH